MDWFLMFIPSLTFSRLMFHVSTKCGYEHCLNSFSEMGTEMIWCMVTLYLFAAIYLVLALYLYQVVPQTYGVPKKWNYLCKGGRNNNKDITKRDTDEIGDLENEREAKE